MMEYIINVKWNGIHIKIEKKNTVWSVDEGLKFHPSLCAAHRLTMFKKYINEISA